MTRMARWNGERIGTLSLRLDAGSCVILGAAVAVEAPFVAATLPLPVWAVVAVGVAVMLWAGLVLLLLARLPLRSALRLVMTANLFASLAVAAVSLGGATVLVVLAVLAIAVDIALFAGSQAVALRRLGATV